MLRSARLSTFSVANSILILLLMVAVGAYVIHLERSAYRTEEATLRQQWYASQKELLASKVRTASAYIAFRTARATRESKRDLRLQTNEMIDIADSIYATEQRGATDAMVTGRIIRVVRGLPIVSGEGTRFILAPGGSDLLGRTSDSGRGGPAVPPALIEHIVSRSRIAESKRSGPISFLAKTGSGSYLVCLGRLGHFGWLVGSVVSTSFIRDLVRADVVPWMRRIRFGDDGNLFMFPEHSGRLTDLNLSMRSYPHFHRMMSLIGGIGPNGSTVLQKLLQRARLPDGGYLSFTTGRSSEHKTASWLAYADIVPATGWLIGGVIDSSMNEAHFAPFVGTAANRGKQIIFSLLALIVVSAILSIVLNRFFHRNVRDALELFNMSFRRSALTQVNMDTNQLKFTEFQRLAEHVDRIISDRRIADERSRLAEERLQQAQKMEAVGRLAGGIAHDFNNLLTVIVGYAEMTLMMPALDSSSRKALEEIYASAHSAASLAQQLLTFSRRRELRPIIFDLNTVVQDLETLLHSLLRENIRSTTQLEPNSAYIKADPHEVERVILNLVLNARDAMPNGGHLYLTVKKCWVTTEEAEERELSPGGTYVALEVRDTGIGIDTQDLTRIFEPFYTTKGTGKGSGLGLSAVFGIVEQSGGRIHVQSQVGRGTTFTVYFPRLEAKSAESGESFVNAVPISLPMTALIVEDDEKVRGMIASVLRQSGLEVYDVGSGSEALDLLRDKDGIDFDILVIDTLMPDMSGARLNALLPRRLTDAKVLFISGHGDDSIPTGASFLLKPFARETLLAKIAEIADLQNTGIGSVARGKWAGWYTTIHPKLG